ncbi:hypothetical protein [Streptomyces sp. NPDC002187]|uniref:hypothetical protein n=1 Tax=Streptomyces sp. NPDC002187 TaxID=3364637 RepID=UPI003697FE04
MAAATGRHMRTILIRVNAGCPQALAVPRLGRRDRCGAAVGEATGHVAADHPLQHVSGRLRSMSVPSASGAPWRPGARRVGPATGRSEGAGNVRADLLVDVPGDLDLAVRLAEWEPLVQSCGSPRFIYESQKIRTANVENP